MIQQSPSCAYIQMQLQNKKIHSHLFSQQHYYNTPHMVHGQVNGYRCCVIYTHVILLSHKKNEIMPFEATWMGLEVIITSEVISQKDKYEITYMWYLKYDTNELFCETETVSQKTYGQQRGNGVGQLGISRHGLQYIKKITNKDQLYNTGNYIEYPVINHNEEGYEKEKIFSYCETCSLTRELDKYGPRQKGIDVIGQKLKTQRQNEVTPESISSLLLKCVWEPVGLALPVESEVLLKKSLHVFCRGFRFS